MLGDNYMTIGGLQVPNPKDGIQISFTNIEQTTQSEAGTDLAVVTRLQKRTFAFTANVTSFWLEKYLTLCGLAQTTLIFNSESITVRARVESASMVADSAYAANTDGLWTVGIKLIEV